MFPVHRFEVVLVSPVRDVLSHVRASDVGVPEMDTDVHALVDDLFDRIKGVRQAPP